MDQQDTSQEVEGTKQEVASEINVESLAKTNERLLKESKTYKQKFNELSKQLQEREEREAAQANDYKKQLELAQQRMEELKGQNKTYKQKTLQTNLYNVAAKVAPDVYDIEDLLNQPKFSDKLVEAIDEDNLEVNEVKLKEYVDAVLKAKPHLKRVASQVVPDTKIPKGKVSTSEGPKDVKSMTREELNAFVKSLGQTKA